MVISLSYYYFSNIPLCYLSLVVSHYSMTSQGEGGVDDAGGEDIDVGKEAATTGMC